MHCEDPGCLKACPGAGRDRQVRQRHRRFHLGELHRLRLLHRRLPVQHSAHQQEGQQGLQVLVVLRSRRRRAGAGVREDLPDRRHHVRHQGRHGGARRKSVVDLKERGFQKAGLYNPQGVGGTHVMYVLQHADRPELYNGLPDGSDDQSVGQPVEGHRQAVNGACARHRALGAFFHYVTRGPKEVDERPIGGRPK